MEASIVIIKIDNFIINKFPKFSAKKGFNDIRGSPAVRVPAGHMYLQNPGIASPCFVVKNKGINITKMTKIIYFK